MKRNFACIMLSLAAVGFLQSAPARLPYEPGPFIEPAAVQLAGSTWIGMLYYENSKVTFHADGTLTYGDPGNGSPGVWKVTGNRLYFEINKYSEYQTIIEGDWIRGTGVNKEGQKCTPNLKRAAAVMLGPVP